MNWKVAGMASTALVAVALTGVSATAGANKFTGKISLAVGQSFEDNDIGFANSIFDDSFTSITGEAQINVAFTGNLNLQLGFIGNGGFPDQNTNRLALDRDVGFQGDAHLYWRTDRYAVGVFAGGGVAAGANFNGFPFIGNPGERTAEYYFAGAEAQYYWNNLTFGINGGYLDSSTDPLTINVPGPNITGDNVFLSNAWFVNGEARWYASPKFALTANVGYISGEARIGRLDVDTIHWGAKAEYWPEEKEPLSLWVAYEGRTSDFDYTSYPAPDFEKEVHTVKVGVTFHFGVDGTQKDNDRSGPAFNTMDYGAIVVGG